jgi:hypothetical protein
LYNDVGLTELKILKNEIKGTLFNFGLKEVTIPQLLISYYNENKKLIFVDHHFLNEGIRIQRKQYFSYQFLNLIALKKINLKEKNFYVNGLDNKNYAEKFKTYRLQNQLNENLQAVNGKGFSYISIEINNYIGNIK